MNSLWMCCALVFAGLAPSKRHLRCKYRAIFFFVKNSTVFRNRKCSIMRSQVTLLLKLLLGIELTLHSISRLRDISTVTALNLYWIQSECRNVFPLPINNFSIITCRLLCSFGNDFNYDDDGDVGVTMAVSILTFQCRMENFPNGSVPEPEKDVKENSFKNGIDHSIENLNENYKSEWILLGQTQFQYSM